jgi:lon-related putative ATP-dependent protease
MIKELKAKECTRACPEMSFTCKSTEELPPLKEIIGQERATRALQFGLRINDKGFNIFVTGMPGTGRKTAIADYIKEFSKGSPVPPDWAYVFNFKDPSRPRALKFPAGGGIQFKKHMEKFVTGMPKALRDAFESEEYTKKRNQTLKTIEEERAQATGKVNKMAESAGFQVVQSPIGLILVPIVKGKPMSEQEFMQLPLNVREKIQKVREGVQGKIEESLRPLRELDRLALEKIISLNNDVASFALEPLFAPLRDEFGKDETVMAYLKELQGDVITNLADILQAGAKPQQQQQAPFPFPMPVADPTANYAVNLIVDNSALKQAPVEIELNPSYFRVFGAIEKEARFGALVTDFTMIRAGAAHRANGGFLVLTEEGLLREPLIYEAMKQTLSNAKLEIEDPATRLGYMATKTLRPEPIPFDAKVTILGSPQVYEILYNLDKEFKELFKVKADFDVVMERSNTNVKEYASFICTLVNKEKLLHLDKSGLGAVVEYSSRLVEDQTKLTVQFSQVADIIREASFYAKEEGAKHISRKHILKQMEEKVYRSNLISQKIDEFIERGVIIIDTEGSKTGEVNGLAVMMTGDFEFGKPSKITASAGVGRDGIINVEREAQMSGPTHTKGVVILGGFINDRYAGQRPLSLTAKLVFEQSYSGVDGDSASSTELYAILSALSGKPINQSIAVTGSVNQKGAVQAIGGVNYKIEGFYEVCKRKGLTGKQGVMIPKTNVENLMLKDEVLEAIEKGKFHIYPVASIDEGIEVLTGVKAGKRKKDGTWEEGSINFLVQQRLDTFADQIKEYRA